MFIGFLGIVTCIIFVIGVIIGIIAIGNLFQGKFIAIPLPFLIAFVLIFIAIKIWSYDSQLAINHSEVQTEYARIVYIDEKSITLDSSYLVINNPVVKEKYPINFSRFHVGDIVEYKFINGIVESFVIDMKQISNCY